MIQQGTIAACARLLPLCNTEGIIDLYATNVDQADHVSHAMSYDFVWSWVPISIPLELPSCEPFNPHAPWGPPCTSQSWSKLSIELRWFPWEQLSFAQVVRILPIADDNLQPNRDITFVFKAFPTRNLWNFKQNKSSLEAWPHVNHHLGTIGHLLSGSLAPHKYRYQVAVASSYWTHPRIAPSCPSLNQHFGYKNKLLPPRSSLITINHHLSSTNTNPSPVTSINHDSPAAAHQTIRSTTTSPPTTQPVI